MKRNIHTSVVTWLTTIALLVSMCASLTFSQRTGAQSKSAQSETPRCEVVSDFPILSKYARDLTQLARQGKLEQAPGHEGDITRVLASLGRVTTKAPVVVGESDLDRDAIARGVAFRLAFGEAPESLRDKRVFSLSIYALAKGAQTSEEFESRVQSVFAEAAKASDQVILFVDQLHQYAGERATAAASAAVKTAIETNHLRVIGGASPEAYAAYVASDANVAKLFEAISIDRSMEGASEEVVAKNKRKSPIDEEFEGEKISPDMRELMQSVGPNGRIATILQVDDVNNNEIRGVLMRVLGDGTVLGDNTVIAMAAMVNGDNTACMQATR